MVRWISISQVGLILPIKMVGMENKVYSTLKIKKSIWIRHQLWFCRWMCFSKIETFICACRMFSILLQWVKIIYFDMRHSWTKDHFKEHFSEDIQFDIIMSAIYWHVQMFWVNRLLLYICYTLTLDTQRF